MFGESTLVIAEAGINHCGDLNKAKQLVSVAALAGCNAIKFQIYKAESRVEKTSPIFEILKQSELDFEVFRELKQCCVDVGIDFLCTAFCRESALYLSELDEKWIKVASFDITNLGYLRFVAARFSIVLLSTGMATMPEIELALETLEANGNPEVVILHCVSSYPCRDSDADLNCISTLRENFPKYPIGYSDHTVGSSSVPLYAVAMGAEVIEKHIRLAGDQSSADALLSADPDELNRLVLGIRELETIKGHGAVELKNVERDITAYRRVSI